jgi:hypothetical protein
MTARTEILKLLRANAGTIQDNIAEFLIRNAEDLLAVGVDERELADAMLRVGLAHMIALDGLPAAVAGVRSRADVIEKAGAEFCQREVRH